MKQNQKTQSDGPLLLNPGWRSIIQPILEERVNNNERLKNWINVVLQPHLEKNIEDYCVSLYVQRIQELPFEHASDRDMLVELQASLIPNAKLRTPMISGDPHIVQITATYTNQRVPMNYAGWRNPQEVHISTEYAITWRPPDRHALRCLMNAMYSGKTILMYAGGQELRDLMDWATQARIPLTPTFLPVKVAIEQSHKWHEAQERRAAKKKVKDTPRGTRMSIGKLTTRTGFSVEGNQTYEVFWLQDQQSLVYETALQRHCIWSYWDRVSDGSCVILHMRNVDKEKDTDRWTIQMGLNYPPGAGDFVTVHQFRGIANCNPHPELSTGFGNLFLASEYSGLFTEDSKIDVAAIKLHLNGYKDIPE